MTRSRRIAFALVAVGIALVAVAVVGMVLADGRGFDPISSYALPNLVLGCGGFAAWGLLIALRRPDLPFGWLFLCGALTELLASATVPWAYYGAASGWPDGLSRALSTLFSATWPIAYFLPVPIAFLLFPDGRAPWRRWRLLVAYQVVVYLGWAVRDELAPSPHGLTGARPPLFAVRNYANIEPTLTAVATALGFGTCAILTATIVRRFRRGDDLVRQQLLWLAFGLGVALAANGKVAATGVGPPMLLIAFEVVPICIAIAILKTQLFDIRLVVSRALVYAVLIGVVIGGFVGLVALADTLLRRDHKAVPVVAALLIALAFNPLRLFFQGRVERLLYGARHDPVLAMSAVSHGLTGGELDGVLDTLRRALHLPYVAIRTTRTLVEAGEAGADATSVPLPGQEAGELLVCPRPGEKRLGTADARVLRLVAGPLAAAVRTAELSADLRESREHLVLAQAEERRRIRHDLHDGLGPALTGFALTVDAASNQLDVDLDLTRRTLDQLRVEMTGAIDDVRQLVYGLRPPALDDLGLLGAVQAQAARLDRRADGTAVAVTVEAPAELPDLPAAVEVAAYRIATEALTNIARHSTARTATVVFSVNGGLEVTVTDDGITEEEWRPGVGLESMTVRATELGGWCSAGPTVTGGVVRARLPLSSAG
jgi:signal transduction histidine kinase